MTDRLEITALLQEINDGAENAPDKLLPLVYHELRKLAQGYMQNERPDHTLQATALVHDAYIRLVDWENVSWQNRAHFFSVAAQVMRNILVDHAVKRKAQKRDFGQRIELTENISFEGGRDVDLIGLNEALEDLEEFEPQQAKIVELRFFGGLTIDEAAHVLEISPATVNREWAIAKTWLYRRLKSE
ncbi:MAG: sigma-70 family RNA polymerase sigma factor [Pyrinomonadaceae bacterium]